jgi:hypothetical protein
MKTKNLVLAAFAFVSAIAGAFAYTFVPENVYVKAREVQGGAIVCKDTGVQCSNSGANICSVQVTTTSAGVQTASSTGTYKTYRPAQVCQNVIFSSQDVSLISGITVYQILP